MRAFRVTVAAADEDLAAAALWEAGTSGIEVRPAPDGRVHLLAYFAGDATAPALALLPPGATVEPAEVPEVDWVARFRESFRAFRAGRFLVAPPWDLPADRSSPGRPRRRSRAGLRHRHPRDDPALPRRPRGASPPDARSAARSTSARAPALLAVAAARLGARFVVRVRHRPRGHQLVPPPRPPQRRPASRRAGRRRPRASARAPSTSSSRT